MNDVAMRLYFFFFLFLVVFIRCVRSYIFSLVYFLSELVDDPLRIRKNENCIFFYGHTRQGRAPVVCLFLEAWACKFGHQSVEGEFASF